MTPARANCGFGELRNRPFRSAANPGKLPLLRRKFGSWRTCRIRISMWFSVAIPTKVSRRSANVL